MSAFTLIEMVIAMAVAVILSSIGIYVVSGYLNRAKVLQTADMLDDLNGAVQTFKLKVGAYPFRLSHLTRPVATTDTTSCSGISPTTRVLYTATQANINWPTASPYFYRTVSVEGLPTPIGVLTDTLRRSTALGTAGRIDMTFTNVQYDDAVALNAVIDGIADANTATNLNTTGAIQWATSSTAGVRLTYGIPVGATC